MPSVIDDTDVLEHPATVTDCNNVQALPLTLPTARRRRLSIFAFLRRWYTPRTPYQISAVSQSHFELPLDILARKHPDLYLRTMSGIG
jgi:hypothetical protein